ncbi:MAG: hypothetical protein FD167_3967 [bacterium]|nr:MAG: hypothetical protein FD167_3967 [bacterium]
MMVVAFNFGHYAAPITCLVYFLVMQCIRKIYFYRWHKKPLGQFVAWSVPTFCISLILLPIALGSDPFFYVNPSPWESSPRTLPNYWNLRRVKLLSELNTIEGKHLVIVRYLSGHNIEHEWVYNEADINNAKVVWARNMAIESNCQLMKYFYDRKVWMLEVDDKTGEDQFYPLPPCR